MSRYLKNILVLAFVAFHALSPTSVYFVQAGQCPCPEGAMECSVTGSECPCCTDAGVVAQLPPDVPEIATCGTQMNTYSTSLPPWVAEPMEFVKVYFVYDYETPATEDPYQYQAISSLEKPPPFSSQY